MKKPRLNKKTLEAMLEVAQQYKQQLATARQEVWEEAATVICVYCLRGDARRSWSHHTNGNVCAAERLWIEQARKKTQP